MTALADLVLAAQQRCDRVNATTITTAEWYSYVNASVQELYGALTSTYEDYNVKSYAVTLVGGAQGLNQFQVGPGSGVPDFFQPRAFWLQIGGSPTPYVTIPRLESFAERNIYTFPSIIPVYGAIPSRWNLMGSTIEVLPPSVAGSSYVLWYVPTMPQLVNPTDTIDQYWLTVNGWSEYVVLDVAAKACIKEESLDTAQLLLMQKKDVAARIMRESMPRDISQPKAIVDMARVRNPWGGWTSGGIAGGGWGNDSSGCW
jgi:hypothetical protein